MRFRLYLSLVLSALVAPSIFAGTLWKPMPGSLYLSIAAVECLTGFVIGIIMRIFIEAVEFAGVVVSNSLGLVGLATGVENNEPLPALASLIVSVTLLLMMLLEFPQQLLHAVLESYDRWPVGETLHATRSLQSVLDATVKSFLAGLQIAAPFLIYGVTVNLMFGLLGRLVPQLPSFFISPPFIAILGLFLLYSLFGMTAARLSMIIESQL